MNRVAIFGGSFNPPHLGHLLAASWVLSTARVGRLMVIPALTHAFGKELAAFPHRRRMAELAFGGLVGAEVSDLEARMGGPSYTVHTLERLAAENPGADLALVVGTDVVGQIPDWHEGHRIEELAELIVVGRGGHEDGERDLVIPEVSSSEIRRRLAAGKSVDALVPWRVRDYIVEHDLYTGEA